MPVLGSSTNNIDRQPWPVGAVLGTSERFWLGLQADFDLEQARRALGSRRLSLQRIAT